MSPAAVAAHGPLTWQVGRTAMAYAHAVADALHARGQDVRVARDPDFHRWVEVTDPETGDVLARFRES